MPSDFIEIVKFIGTFALLAVAVVVLFIILVSIIDRHPRKESGLRKDDDAKSGKQ